MTPLVLAESDEVVELPPEPLPWTTVVVEPPQAARTAAEQATNEPPGSLKAFTVEPLWSTRYLKLEPIRIGDLSDCRHVASGRCW